MNNTKTIGNEGEDIAVKYLKKLGYKILDRNYFAKHCEIDIVAKDKDAIVFVEVKRRQNDDFARPSFNVTIEKQHRIVLAAKIYLLDKKIDALTRFDVIEIEGEKINHIIGAFRAF